MEFEKRGHKKWCISSSRVENPCFPINQLMELESGDSLRWERN